MKNQELKKARKAMSTIAEAENVSMEEVLSEMKAAIAEGMNSGDPAVQEMWRSVPCKGEVPEPEEVIAWAARAARERLRI